MPNEQRAHDISLAITNYYLDNPNKLKDFNFDYENLIDTSYNLYLKIYNVIAKYVAEDFKNEDLL